MRIHFVLLFLLIAGTSGCEQQQTKILSLREEFQRQLQTKEKTIEELNRKVSELSELNSQLQQGLLKNSQDSGGADRLAGIITESVAKRVEDQNTAVKAKLDEVLQTLRGGAIGTGSRDTNGQSVTPPTPPPVREPVQGDTNRKKYKFDF